MKFNPHFNIKKIIQSLEKIATSSGSYHSSQAASTLGELYYMKGRENKEAMDISLKYYEMAAKLGCGYAQYWVGYINVLTHKKLDVAFNSFLSSYKLGNINAAYQLYLLYSKTPEYMNVIKAYNCLKKCCDFGLDCFEEIKIYFKEHVGELKNLEDMWKSWPDAELIKIFNTEMDKQYKKMLDAQGTDALYKRPSVVFLENKGNWFLTIQARNVNILYLNQQLVKTAINYTFQEFIICLKDELLPVFSSVGLYLLENWLSRTRGKKKDTKEKQQAIHVAIDLVNLYLAEVLIIIKQQGIDGLIEKLKRSKKKPVQLPPRLRYNYADYIHPSYFKALQEPTSEIICASCKKPEGAIKYQFCSACKKVFYCSKECQKNDWKVGHKTECAKLKENQ